jgi:hypothetical protein
MRLLSKVKSREGVVIASCLFVLQFIYYQFQGYLDAPLVSMIPAYIVDLTHVNNPRQLGNILHIIVHASFSVVIVHFLYANRSSTLFVVRMSVLLISVFAVLYILRIFLHADVIKIAASNLLMFLATPFKTIFSIPALKLQPKNTSN